LKIHGWCRFNQPASEISSRRKGSSDRRMVTA
jgi:hypothetical protein